MVGVGVGVGAGVGGGVGVGVGAGADASAGGSEEDEIANRALAALKRSLVSFNRAISFSNTSIRSKASCKAVMTGGF